ncbi:hypothetical protein FVP45_12495, partial [Mycobacterium tuberculosis]|nr:hypothetical protein [Mycobacterium tuberculosis]
GEGFATLIRTPALYAWILVLPIGLMLQQSSLRVGALTASLPTTPPPAAPRTANPRQSVHQPHKAPPPEQPRQQPPPRSRRG